MKRKFFKCVVAALLVCLLPPKADAEAGPYVTGNLSEMEALRKLDQNAYVGQLEKEIEEKGADAVPQLIMYLDDQDQRVQGFAVDLLGRIGDPRAVEPLIEHIGSAGDTTHIVRALYKIGNNVPLVLTDDQITILKNIACDGYNGAVVVIQQSRGRDAIGVLWEICRTAKEKIESNGAQYEHEAEGYVAVKVSTPYYYVLKECYKYLISFDDTSAKIAVAELLKSERAEDRTVGLMILAKVDVNMTADVLPLLEDRRESIFNQWEQKYNRVCDLAANVLREFHDVELETPKEELYTDKDLEKLIGNIRSQSDWAGVLRPSYSPEAKKMIAQFLSLNVKPYAESTSRTGITQFDGLRSRWAEIESNYFIPGKELRSIHSALNLHELSLVFKRFTFALDNASDEDKPDVLKEFIYYRRDLRSGIEDRHWDKIESVLKAPQFNDENRTALHELRTSESTDIVPKPSVMDGIERANLDELISTLESLAE
ncbi:MAG: HEAT repeat domain-containing protein [Pontiellaceae bacterium]|nr:HEAT repeat domain-containing protein [Pontiellaceae bacterium]